ncbi:DUF4012 domain-containing protein [Rathayibacter sp. KR2-224]|uniref:DUF4012 domain-containing protein n=1 Tax=Rathayibacter sp. KR2-224 TaxID=3400913 RepID=UPI003C067871
MSDSPAAPRASRRVRRRVIGWSIVGIIVLVLACAAWVTVRALDAKNQLEASLPLVQKAQAQISLGDSAAASATTRVLAAHLHAARDDTGDPIWRVAELIPGIGANLSAVRQIAWATSDVTDRAVAPLAKLAGTINLASFKPVNGAVPLKPLVEAAPIVTRADSALQSDLALVRGIDASATITPVRNAVQKLTDALAKAAAVTDAASRGVRLLPAMLGASGPRDYVLVIQNNAEARATGGIVGALALLRAQDGRISLVSQASAADFPALDSPVIPLPAATQKLYGSIVGEYIQDATLTPDFATSGAVVQAMWQKRFGTKVDGVLSMDPVALSYLLKATGPVGLGDGEQLSSDNAVQVLLSTSYARFSDPLQQNAFFASAAAAVFNKVASGQFDSTAMLSALTQAGEERRVLVWSGDKKEQAILAGTPLAGGLPGSSGGSAGFGVYLNDATGAKMDYYLHTGIGLGAASCRKDGRPDYLVRVTLSSDAPADAAQSLPGYVTGAGLSGVPAGDTYTTVAVYAPPGFVVVGATTSGKQVPIQRVTDAKHGVAQLLVKLHPGQSSVYSFQFVGAQAKQPSQKAHGAQVQATPGVWPTRVQAVPFSCADIMR